MVQMNFDARSVPFSEPGLPVWSGMVPVQIVRSEVKPTAKNDGNNMLIFHVAALAGEFRGQENAIRLNLWNANAQAVDIAQRQLSSISHVIGRMAWTDTEQLIGGQFLSVWAKEEREVTDQQTGQQRKVESCQCKDFRFLDGRTIREAMSGQPASTPYDPNARPAATSGPVNPAAPPAAQAMTAPPQPGAMPPAGQPGMQGHFGQNAPPAAGQGFQPPGAPPAPGGFAPPQGAPQAGFTPPPQAGGQPGQFAPPMGGGAPAGGYAPAPGGAPQAPQPGPGMQTAASGFSPPQGYGAPQQGYAPQPGAFQPPGAPQAGPGPWGPGQR